MTVGLEIIGESSQLQISSETFLLTYKETLEFEFNSQQAPQYSGEQVYSGTKYAQFVIETYTMYAAPSGGTQTVTTDGIDWAISVHGWNTTGSKQTVKVHVFDRADANTFNEGLEIYNEDGEVAYSSGALPLSMIPSIITPSANYGFIMRSRAVLATPGSDIYMWFYRSGSNGFDEAPAIVGYWGQNSVWSADTDLIPVNLSFIP